MQKRIFIVFITLFFLTCAIRKDTAKEEKAYIVGLFNTTKEDKKTPLYESSIAKWNTLKKKHHNSYTYKVDFNSFTGYSSTTVITVKKGSVINRAFYETSALDQKTAKKQSFVENRSTLNTHKQGSPAVTIDQLYKDCSEKYLTVDEKSNRILFKVDNIGVLTVCGYIPKNCADDCFKGVSVGEIKWSH